MGLDMSTKQPISQRKKIIIFIIFAIIVIIGFFIKIWVQKRLSSEIEVEPTSHTEDLKEIEKILRTKDK